MAVCNVCKKSPGFSSVLHDIGSVQICTKCLAKLDGFSEKKAYDDHDLLISEKKRIIDLANRLEYPQEVVSEIEKVFERKEAKFIPNSFMMTTTHGFDGYVIQDYRGVVTGTVVVGGGIGSGFVAGLANFTGGEAWSYSEQLDRARDAAIARAISKARLLGANALVGVDIEFTTIGQSSMGVVVNGTAVIIEKIS